MKNITAVLLTFTLLFTLAACGKKSSESPSETPAVQAESVTADSDDNAKEQTEDAEGKDSAPEGAVTDETKLGEAITTWVEGDYLYLKIKTSEEIDAKRYNIDIVNPGIYLTRDSAFINQAIYGEVRCLDEEFDKEWFDGFYVFKLDNNIITGLASDESEWAPGTWSMLLYNGDTGFVFGQWLIVLEGGGKYHFEYSDSWLKGAGEERKAKEFGSLEDEVASWFTLNAYSEDWSEFFFDGFYLEETDPEGYDSYYMMICPEGDYTTYEEADAADFTYSGIGEKCPYKFSMENYCVPDLGRYTFVLAKMGGNVEVQFDAEKVNASGWKMDFSGAKCPALSGKYGVDGSSGDTEDVSVPDGDPVEYSREYWEEKYPGENICPFSIDENGVEHSYYWVSGFDGWDGTMGSWIGQPFNWNGWHKAEDGCIVNEDETLKITDNWANGDESMSSYCMVTTEKYDKDNAGNQNTEVSEDWPFTDYAKPENCKIDEVEDWGSFAKVYVQWENKEAAKAYKEALGLSSGTIADIDGAYEYTSSKVMISYSETNSRANFVLIYE